MKPYENETVHNQNGVVQTDLWILYFVLRFVWL